MHDKTGFEELATEAGDRLRRAFVATHGVEGAADAAATAVAWAWEHRDRVLAMDNPVGFLYRVGQSRSRRRREPVLPSPDAVGVPDVEPALVPALLALPRQQRTAVWLVHGCGWPQREAADAMGISASAVATHVARALVHLRTRLGVDAPAQRPAAPPEEADSDA